LTNKYIKTNIVENKRDLKMIFNKIVCYDLEMCCWDDGRSPRTGEIIEVGLAIVDLEKKEIIKRGQYYVIPDNDGISDFCTSLTGITQHKINKQGRKLVDVVESIRRNFGGKQAIYASWGRDDKVLFSECDRKDIEKPFYETLNVKTLYKLQHKDNGRYGMKKAIHRNGLEMEGKHHSGADDAYNLGKLLISMDMF
jgi:inhibitor of KinA sporulation pathway (predicted exonuclease)